MTANFNRGAAGRRRSLAIKSRSLAVRQLLTWLFILSGLTVCYGQTAVRQSGSDTEPAIDPRQILQQAAVACQNIKTIEYQEEQFTGGDDKDPPVVTARILQTRADVPSAGLLPGKFLIEGTANYSKPVRFAISYDGASLRLLDGDEKVVKVLRSPTPYEVGGILGMQYGLVGIGHFTIDQPFTDFLAEGVTYVYEGVRNIDGVPCHVVTATRKISHPLLGTQDSTTSWFIGREDHLPRGLAGGRLLKHIRILKVNPPATPIEYVVDTPTGYGEQPVTGLETKTRGLLAVGTDAPAWTLLDPQGHPHSLSEYRGKVVLLDFWGTWCVPCRKTMPNIQSLHDQFKARGVVVYGISVVDKEGNPVAYMKQQGFTYGLLLNGEKTAALYKTAVLPTLYLIGIDGKIIHAEYGFRDQAGEDLKSIIDQYLKNHQM